ncbi:MAG: IS66 family insertion sequence element accessory protein TnpB [Anaerolineae bacterium]|nr:IS66 family insertion sequence element accessory protein TnpB [Anaerolineae bacterium]MCZ2099361.1 IS66 family insertion sequence element accessory protein TnpB [Anaerolineae bacterium]MCZ2099663.1 IS66 family insertion sequence element accessory protein TnpB [Anaerolineae bacterium]
MNAGAGVRIWLAFEPVDMRLSFDGLAAKVAHVLEHDPYCGHWFVFRSRNGTRIKILTFDGVGWWLHYRRLESGTFTWPSINAHGAIELSSAQFAVLTQGLDWRRVQLAQRFAPMIA